MNSTNNRDFVKIEGLTTLLGYAFGLAQPSLIAHLAFASQSGLTEVMSGFVADIDRHLPPDRLDHGKPGQVGRSSTASAAYTLFLLSSRIQEAAYIPVTGPARFLKQEVTARSTTAEGSCVLAMPSLIPLAAVNCLTWLITQLNEFAASPRAEWFTDEKRSGLLALVKKIRNTWASGTNDQHFIRAAHTLNIPVLLYPDRSVQYGWGSGARTMASSFTDRTPGIYIGMARNKMFTNEFLRQGGISVPRQLRIYDQAQLLENAAKFGYPVVIKPADCDGGLGATAGIQSETDLLKAYARALQHSKNILLEKHITGSEFRLLVVHGKLFWAHERVPAQVIGDGCRSVSELIESLNEERNRMPATGFSDIPIEITDEVLEVLQSQQLSLESIPPQGSTVRLARVPTIRTGGALRSVSDIIHEDNRKMAERAARLMRLDIAGIDFLTTDITQSWRDTGGAITEINSRPQINRLGDKEIHVDLMKVVMTSDGRIPAFLILGSEREELSQGIVEKFARLGLEAGISTQEKVRIGNDNLLPKKNSLLMNTRSLLLDPTLDVLVVFSNGEQLVRSGLPVDRFDSVIVANWTEPEEQLLNALSFVRPHLAGEVVLLGNDPHLPALSKSIAESKIRLFNTNDELVSHLTKAALDHHHIKQKTSAGCV